ncbi:hypothetical protein ABH926_006377 [Catenulispora sp. GP43]|uniref:DUF1707 SHOCT-like domain-containing protein n=1 Tax=Catenulispora sp. GP43 TaxID=3156263 RepID=UPI003512CAE6
MSVEMKASHADRDQVVDILRDASADGRLTGEELDERVEAALSARTVGELADLTRDLPVPAVEAAPATERDVVVADQRFGTLQRVGVWRVPRRFEIKMVGGDVRLDFTEAVSEHGELELYVEVGFGGDLVLITKPGVSVETENLKVRMGDIKIRTPRSDANTPVTLRVKVSGRVSGDVIVRYPRRTLGQWVRGESSL